MSEYNPAKTGDVLFWYNKHCCTFWCPGCKQEHPYYISQSFVREDGTSHPIWSFDGNMENPTFNPSLLCLGTPKCHLYVHGGKIIFLSDCEHELKGQTVTMIKWDSELNDWKT